MPTGNWRVELVEGIRQNKRRAVAFLECDGIDWINAKEVFGRLRKKDRWNLTNRFEHWIDGFNYPKYFHGWNLSQYGGKYTSCFVFKLPGERFYGFLAHPFKEPGAVLCVIAIHVPKDQWETEETDLKRIMSLKNDKTVNKALEMSFYDG